MFINVRNLSRQLISEMFNNVIALMFCTINIHISTNLKWSDMFSFPHIFLIPLCIFKI